MEFNFTLWERALLGVMIGNVRGEASRIRKATKLLDVLDFTDEEKQRFGIAVNEGMVSWTSSGQDSCPVTIEDGNLVVFLQTEAKNYTSWPASPKGSSVALMDKLGVKDDTAVTQS